MHTPNTSQLLSTISRDLHVISGTAPANEPIATVDSPEMKELREKLAQAERLSNQSLTILTKQKDVIKALKDSNSVKDLKIREMEAIVAGLKHDLSQQNTTISRLLCLPPNARDIPL